MGWNGSKIDNMGRSSAQGIMRGGHHRKILNRHRVAVAGLSVIILGIFSASYFIFGRGSGKESLSRKPTAAHSSQIADVGTNSTKVSTALPRPAKAYKDMSREEKIKYWRDKFGNNLPDNIKPIVYYLENPPQQTYRGKSRPEAIFRHKSERQIAAFLSVTPGNWMMRPKVFDKSFDDDFTQSMCERIEILPNDTEEQRQLKELVINAKKELAARLKAGETPSEIMTATAKELYDLGQYRRNLQKEVIAAQHDPNLSDQDVADTVEAANKMLEAKGLKGLRTMHPAIRQAYISRRAEKASIKAGSTKTSGGTER